MSTEFINDQWRLPNAWNGSESNVNKQSNFSLSFDGSQYIGLGNPTELQITGQLSISLWFKTSTSSGVRLVSKDYGSFNRCYGAYINAGQLGFFIFKNNVFSSVLSNTSNSNDNNWHNAVFINNGTSLSIYIDGVLRTSTNTAGGTIDNDVVNFEIGRRQDNTQYFDGQIDAVSIFNYALTDGTGGTVNQIAALYGSSSTGIGNPMSLSPKPVAFYQLGDKSAFNGANYLAPNIAAQEDDGDIAASYSPYALDFDGGTDYIDLGTQPIVTGEFSISTWIKRSSTSVGDSSQVIIGKDSQTSSRVFNVFISLSGVVGFWVSDTGTYVSTYRVDTSTLINDTNWHNLIVINNGNNNNNQVFIDGTEASYSLQGTGRTTLYNTTAIKTSIGADASTGTTYNFNGSISNLSIWNAGLTQAQVTELYNEGVPSNLNNHSAYSNLVSWWQLGSNSSFNTNWTVLDEKGSNNGTSVNMGEDAIVDGVGSYANGLSSGMGGDEVIGDAPYSTANALSVNMDVLDRVTDTPS